METKYCERCKSEVAASAKFCRNCGATITMKRAASALASVEGTNMSEQTITPDNVSKELLKSILEAAYVDVSLDKDGDLLVKEGNIKSLVFPHKEQSIIKLYSGFNLQPTANLLKKLECINKINKDYIMVSAYVAGDSLRCTYDLSLQGGLSAKAFVLQLKRFCQIARTAVLDYGKDLVS